MEERTARREDKTKHVNMHCPANMCWTAAQTARRNKLAEYLFQKYSINDARQLTKTDLGLPTYSRTTAYSDYDALLKEWQSMRVDNMDQRIAEEIGEIEYTQRRLWQRVNERNGRLKKRETKGRANGTGGLNPITGKQTEAEDDSEIRYIHEINELSKERRKLLGLYAAEKREITGGNTFAQAMMAAAVVQAQQSTIGAQGADLAADGKPIDWNEI